MTLREPALRLLAFLGLAAFAAGHWAALVEDPPSGRVVAVVLVAVAGGGAVAVLAGRLPALHGLVRLLLALAVALGVLCAALLAVGLPGYMLVPSGWGEVGDVLDRGLAGLETVDWPYSGSDEYVRLTLLLALPATLAPAAALAFWPDERLQPVLRVAALVLLLVLYGVAVTEKEPAEPLRQGLLLLALVAAWLWLPRLAARQVPAAAAAVAAAGALALPFAAGLDAEKPWIDYESWRWGDTASATDTFDWNHGYGPIDWPRQGTTVLNVRSERPHYWRAQTLNHFDGLRWRNTGSRSRAGVDFPERTDPRWEEEIRFTVRSLTSEVVVSAGMTFDVDIEGEVPVITPDGTIRLVDGQLEKGDSYTVRTYVPDPNASEMRAPATGYDERAREHTYFLVPRPAETVRDEQGGDASFADARPRAVTLPLWGVPGTGTPGAARAVLDSPYGRTYRLARRLAAGQPTAYDVVKRIETHLQRNYRYSESPPHRDYPLAAFLFRDREGYCQQYSGAMALMLRMNGIPARVAGGFAPGVRNAETGEYRVGDLDAHSWVEVYFPGIGWVPFDPTPSAAPAESQSGGAEATSAARGDARDAGAPGPNQPAPRASRSGPGSPDQNGSTLPIWLIPAALMALALVAAAVVALVLRPRPSGEGGDADLVELRAVLERLGYEVPPGTTLLELERRLALVAGSPAARYVRILRERRFAPPGRRTAGGLDRRALRRALTAPLGLTGRVRGWWALPPRLGGTRFRTT